MRPLTRWTVLAGACGAACLTCGPGSDLDASDTEVVLETGEDGVAETDDVVVDISSCIGGRTRCGDVCVDLDRDPTNCDYCGHVCPAGPHSLTSCVGGVCRLECDPGWVDADDAPGCECLPTTVSDEECDGVDNDCDGTVDEGFLPPRAPDVLLHANGAMTGSIHAPVGFNVNRPQFRWHTTSTTHVCGTVTFEVQMDDSCSTPGFATCGFPSPEVSVAGLPGPAYRHGVDAAATAPVGTRYYWRMRSCAPFGICSEWTPTRYLDVGRVPNDFNGDGYSDALIGAPDYGDGVTAGLGRIEMYLGGEPVDAVADLVLDGSSGNLGSVVVGLGDVNADGFADFAVSTPGATVAGVRVGRVDVFLGGAVPDLESDWSVDGEQDGERFGEALGVAGDVNGDGFADLVVGAPGYDAASPDVGRVLLFLGDRDGLGSDPDLELVGSESGADFGGAVCGFADLNLDGYADLAVGSPLANSGEGHVQVFLGGDPPHSTPRAEVADPSGWDAFGRPIAPAGLYLSPLHYPDVFVSGQHLLYGEVHVYGGALGAFGFLYRSTLQFGFSRLYGAAVAGIGDANDDGSDDVAVGQPDSPHHTGVPGGAVHLGLDSSSRASTMAYREAWRDTLGAAVAGVGDMDGDGFADCLAGSPGPSGSLGSAGGAYLLRGDPVPDWTWVEVSDPTFPGTQRGSRFGAAVASGPLLATDPEIDSDP